MPSVATYRASPPFFTSWLYARCRPWNPSQAASDARLKHFIQITKVERSTHCISPDMVVLAWGFLSASQVMHFRSYFALILTNQASFLVPSQPPTAISANPDPCQELSSSQWLAFLTQQVLSVAERGHLSSKSTIFHILAVCPMSPLEPFASSL